MGSCRAPENRHGFTRACSRSRLLGLGQPRHQLGDLLPANRYRDQGATRQHLLALTPYRRFDVEDATHTLDRSADLLRSRRLGGEEAVVETVESRVGRNERRSEPLGSRAVRRCRRAPAICRLRPTRAAAPATPAERPARLESAGVKRRPAGRTLKGWSFATRAWPGAGSRCAAGGRPAAPRSWPWPFPSRAGPRHSDRTGAAHQRRRGKPRTRPRRHRWDRPRSAHGRPSGWRPGWRYQYQKRGPARRGVRDGRGRQRPGAVTQRHRRLSRPGQQPVLRPDSHRDGAGREADAGVPSSLLTR